MAAVVQSVQALASSATSISVTISGVQAGSTLLAHGSTQANTNGTPITSTGPSALTWTQDGYFGYTSTAVLSRSSTTVAGTYVVTYTPPSTVPANAIRIVVIEARLDTTQLDVAGPRLVSSGSNPSATATSSALNTTNANDLIVAAVQVDGSTALTGAGDYTVLRKNETLSTGAIGAVQVKDVTATGSQTAPFSFGTAQTWGHFIAAYRAVPVGVALEGTASGSGTTTVALAARAAIVGFAPGSGAVNATLTPTLPLVGTAVGSGRVDATLVAPLPQGAIVGSASGSGAATATLTTTPATLGGTLPGTGAASAALGVPAIVLAGTALGSGATVVTLSVPAVTLAGTASGSGATSATLLFPFGGRLTGAGDASATVLVRVGVGGRLAGLGAASGTLDVRPFLYRTILVTTGGRRG